MVTRTIVETFRLFLPSTDNVLQFFTDASPGAFSTASGAIDYPSFKEAFDTWYWLNRIAAILKKWKITLAEFEAIIALQTPAQLLDFKTLPLDGAAPVAPIDAFLRTSLLFRRRDTLPETGITLLEIFKKLNGGNYPTAADFAAFANPAVGKTESDTLTQLLRSKFGPDTWLTLSTEMRDVLRESKRDALADWLLHQFEPTSPRPPSGKWENTNDVYGYYLLDWRLAPVN